jgi:outer membrane protein
MLSRSVRVLLASAACLSFGVVASAQVKVAIIDMREAVNGTAEVKKAVASLEARVKPKQAEAEKIQRELADLQSKLQSLQGKLTPQGEQEMLVQGKRREKDLQRIQEDVNAELEQQQQEVGTRALQRMRDVVKKLAEEQQLDVVDDTSQTIYFKPALTITKAAIEGYDKAYPAK